MSERPITGGAQKRFSFRHRQLPRPAEFKDFLKFESLRLDPVQRRVNKIRTVQDAARIARRRTPKPVFEYVSGAAESEISLARAQAAFRRVEFEPRVLKDVSDMDLSTEILGHNSELPLIFAPTGFTRMMQFEGEPAVAGAAASRGIPYALSTMGTTSIAQLEDAAPEANLWFQLYLWKDREGSRAFLRESEQAGWDTLVVTVDTPVPGNRLRDERNGLTLPPKLTAKTFANMATRPAWWLNMLTTAPIEFASLEGFDGTPSEVVSSLFDPSLNFNDLEWIRSEWKGNLVVKGIQSVTDAHAVVDSGADAIVLSNHGGRQLDRAPDPLELVPQARAELGDEAQIFMDTGITTGADMLAAVGLGADAVMVGRAYLYGLMAAGQRGVEKTVDVMEAEARRTLALTGSRTPRDLRGRVSLRETE